MPAGWQQALAAVDTAAHAVGITVRRSADDYAPFHPGRCAKLAVTGADGSELLLGHAGEVHPSVCRAFGLPVRAAAMEISLDVLLAVAPGPGMIVPVSSHPVAKEDVALVVDEAVTADAVRSALVAGAGELLESIHLFDIYRGSQIPERQEVTGLRPAVAGSGSDVEGRRDLWCQGRGRGRGRSEITGGAAGLTGSPVRNLNQRPGFDTD